MHKDLGLTKVQLVQEMKPLDHLMHLQLAQWSKHRLDEDEYISRKIVFSYEAHYQVKLSTKSNCLVCHAKRVFVFKNLRG